MTLKENIERKSREIRKSIFETNAIGFIPNVDTIHRGLTFGCTGVRLRVTVLYIDMRGSTQLLRKHNRNVVAKIHMTYYHAIVMIATKLGGQVRSFNGDSLLVFFRGDGTEIVRNAVKCAFHIRYALTEIVNQKLTGYTDVDFGIGVDCGDVIATKVGVGGSDDNKDLIWIGDSVNKATRISNECRKPEYVGVSKAVYDKLGDELRKVRRVEDGFFGKRTREYDAWKQSYMTGDYNECIYKSEFLIELY